MLYEPVTNIRRARTDNDFHNPILKTKPSHSLASDTELYSVAPFLSDRSCSTCRSCAAILFPWISDQVRFMDDGISHDGLSADYHKLIIFPAMDDA